MTYLKRIILAITLVLSVPVSVVGQETDSWDVKSLVSGEQFLILEAATVEFRKFLDFKNGVIDFQQYDIFLYDVHPGINHGEILVVFEDKNVVHDPSIITFGSAGEIPTFEVVLNKEYQVIHSSFSS